MSAKIIKKGDPRKIDPTLRGKCRTCGCEFELPRSEATYWCDQRDNDASGHYATCPQEGCNNKHVEVK